MVRDLRRYGVASAFSFALVLALTAFFHELVGISEAVAPALALILAFGVNFTLLRRWVFPGQETRLGRQAAETAVVSLAFRVFEYGLFLAIHLGLGVSYLIATGAALCLSALGKFLVYREIVFNRRRSAASAPGSR